MSRIAPFWIFFTLLAIGGAGAIAISGWQHYASVPRSVMQAQAEACVAKNRTWSPRFDMFGAMVGIRCNKTKYLENGP